MSAATIPGRQEEAGEAAEVHISSLLVHCSPDRLAALRVAIERLADAEIHGTDACGKLVVTLETNGAQRLQERLATIRGLPGVHAASLVYHQVEPA